MSPRMAVLIVALLAATSAAALAQGFPSTSWAPPDPALQPSPAWRGGTGLVAVPSAAVTPLQKAEAAGHWLNREPKAQWWYVVNVGLLDNLEIGGVRVENEPLPPPAVSGLASHNMLTAKYRLNLGKWTSLGAEAPDVAVGVWDLTNEMNRAYYVVLSKEFTLREGAEARAINGHLGWGRSDLRTGALDGFFAGIEFSPLSSTLVQLEWDGNDFNAAARYFIRETFAIDAGLLGSDFAAGVTLATTF